jgi:hypothetical protein
MTRFFVLYYSLSPQTILIHLSLFNQLHFMPVILIHFPLSNIVKLQLFRFEEILYFHLNLFEFTQLILLRFCLTNLRFQSQIYLFATHFTKYFFLNFIQFPFFLRFILYLKLFHLDLYFFNHSKYYCFAIK